MDQSLSSLYLMRNKILHVTIHYRSVGIAGLGSVPGSLLFPTAPPDCNVTLSPCERRAERARHSAGPAQQDLGSIT